MSRSSSCPLVRGPMIADVTAGCAGNEGERLALLREHHERVTGQMGRLAQCLDLITFKVGLYEDLLDQDRRGAEPDQRRPSGGGEVPASAAGASARP
ncbi:hypothetical protein [Micromonospora profundi]|uniref:hypothetical protein n=1 Tax=Micromonospora profundi TaxID=1420889 RepID=UPI0036481633